MDKQPVILSVEMTVRELADEIARGEGHFSDHQAFLIFNEKRLMMGESLHGETCCGGGNQSRAEHP